MWLIAVQILTIELIHMKLIVVRNLIKNGVISPDYVRGVGNLIDPFIKGLAI